ncbi:elongation factor 1-beta [Candidatus Altiarchaeota archaeon]
MTDWNVVAKMKIMPEGIETDLEDIKFKMKELCGTTVELYSADIKPIAFGLNCLEVNILMNDKAGGLDELQEKIKALDGVSEAEVIDLNRL